MYHNIIQRGIDKGRIGSKEIKTPPNTGVWFREERTVHNFSDGEFDWIEEERIIHVVINGKKLTYPDVNCGQKFNNIWNDILRRAGIK